MKSVYKIRLENLLNYEVVRLDNTIACYIARKSDNRVTKCVISNSWQGISEQVAYSIAMFGEV